MIRKFLSDSGFSVGNQMIGLVFSIVTSAITARMLGAYELGLVAFAMLIPATVQALIGSGYAPAVIYMTASGKWLQSEVIPRTLGLWIYASVTMMAVAIATVYGCIALFPSTPPLLMFLALALIPTASLSRGFDGVLTSNRLFRQLFYRSMAVSPFRLACVLIFVYWLDMRSIGVLICAIANELLTLVIGFYLVKKVDQYRKSTFRPQIAFTPLRSAIWFGLRSGLGNVVAFLNYRADQFIVKGIIGASGLGIYTIAVNLAEKLWLVANNVSSVLLPMVAADKSDQGSIERFTAKTSILVLAGMLILGSIAASLSRPVVLLLYGPEFKEVANVLIWLMPGIILFAPSKLLANYIAGKGRPELNSMRAFGALIINITLNFLLIPMWGITGAAIATSISYSVSALINAIIFYSVSGQSLRKLLLFSEGELNAIKSNIRKTFSQVSP